MTPDGRHVYAANSATDSVTPFSVNGDGSLTRMACLPADCGTGSSPRGLAVTPDGRFLYAANHGSDSVSVFSIGSNGALTKVTCTTDCQGPSSGLPVGVAVSPDGRFLYVTNGDPVGSVTNGIVPFSINSDGTLTPIACSDCGTSPEPQGIGVSPDSKFVFASNFAASGLLSAFSIGSTGSLTRIACASPTCDIGNSDEFQSLVVAPQRAPTASFRAGPMPAGQTSNFDGSASRGSGQALARYDWSFGDGGQALDAGSSVTHVYSQAGTYTVTLTVTDDTGCSARVIYTGQTASCSGGPSATQSQSLSVPGVTQPGFSIGSAKLNKKKGTAQLPVTPSQPGSLRLTGSGVAEQSVAASGTVNLLIKPIGKAKKKLGGKGKLSVSVTVTYTPGGGQASSKTATVKLKKVR